jgi:hypothetical protein
MMQNPASRIQNQHPGYYNYPKIIALLEFFNFVSEVSRLQFATAAILYLVSVDFLTNWVDWSDFLVAHRG